MEQALAAKNKSLADFFELSPLATEWDPEVLLATIIRNYSSLPCLYEDPDWYYSETEMWWKSHKDNFERLYNTLKEEYDPLENYDRMEDWTDTGSEQGQDSRTRNGSTVTDNDTSRTTSNTEVVDEDGSMSKSNSSTTDNDETVTTSRTEDVDKDIKTNKSAFDVSTYSPIGQTVEDSGTTESGSNITDGTVSTTGSESGTNSTDRTTTNSGSETGTEDITVTSNETESGNNSVSKSNRHTARIHGNIGVMTATQMATAELSLRVQSAYGIIAKVFADEMLLSIW